MVQYVRLLRSCGLNVIPCGRDKRPLLKWKHYQKEMANENLYPMWFSFGAKSIGVITGAISGNLEMLDFDDGGSAFEEWRGLVEDEDFLLPFALLLEKSQRGGIHVVYRCPGEKIPGSMKLAATEDHRVLIETRGEGGYFLCAPSPGYCVIQGSMQNIPQISPEERDILIRCARKLNREAPPVRKPAVERQTQTHSDAESPADEFNRTVTFRDLLTRHRWTWAHSHGDRDYYWRPGKAAGTISADVLKGETLYVFSTAAHPFQEKRAYSKFQAYAMLEHEGDEQSAAKAIVRKRPTQNRYRAAR